MNGQKVLKVGVPVLGTGDCCSSCKMSRRIGKDLECRRYPPTVAPIIDVTPTGPRVAAKANVYPVVQGDWWCGEYVKKLVETNV